MRKPLYAPLEGRWTLLEDDLPRQAVLCFHGFLRDNEISAGRRFTLRERLGALRAWVLRHPSLIPVCAVHYPEGHMTSLAVNMPSDSNRAVTITPSCCGAA